MGHGYVTEFDGTGAWVHRSGECVARFGRKAFEVYGASNRLAPVAYATRAGAEQWEAFERLVMEEHGYRVPRSAAPSRLHVALGLAYRGHTGDFLVPVPVLAGSHDPFAVNVWGRSPVTVEGVGKAVALRDLEPLYVETSLRGALPPSWDTRRIAYLAAYPDETPVLVNILDEDGRFEISDGYHRLAAAIFRGDALIAASFSGFMAGFETHFSASVPIVVDAARRGTAASRTS